LGRADEFDEISAPVQGLDRWSGRPEERRGQPDIGKKETAARARRPQGGLG